MLRALKTGWINLWDHIEGPELEPFPWHSHYPSVWAAHRALSSLGKRLRGTILDIGSGTGFGASFLDPRQTGYLPLDLPSGRPSANRRITLKPRPPKIIASGYSLPIRDNSISGVMALNLLEHVTHPRSILREAHRVLAPDGFILVSTPFAFPRHGLPNDYWRWTPEGLDLEIKAAGFSPVQSVSTGKSLAALATNINLLFKHTLMGGGSRWLRGLLHLTRPLAIIAQFALNMLTVALDGLDRSEMFPLGVAVLARKAVPDVNGAWNGNRHRGRNQE